MSIAAVAWALEQPVCPPPRKLVLVALAQFADAEGKCWPKQDVIARQVGIGVRMVKKHLRILVAEGYVSATNHGQRGNVYNLSIKGNSDSLHADTVVPPSILAKGNSSASVSGELRGTPVQAKGNSSVVTSLFNRQEPSEKSAAAVPADTHARESPAWTDDLYRLGWADGQRLSEKDTARIISDFGALDLTDEVERFRAYWSVKGKPPGTWNTYLRLRTWLRNAKERTQQRGNARTNSQPHHERPSANGATRDYSDWADAIRVHEQLRQSRVAEA